MTETVECPICGKKVKNLGSHKYHSHKDEKQPEVIVDNHIKDKPLSELIEEIRQLLKPYHTTFAVSTFEEGDVVGRIDLAIGIRTRR